MWRLLFLCGLLFARAFASIEEPQADFVGDEGLLSPGKLYHPKENVSFLPYIPKVNVITGEYCEQECDLVMAGIEPLSYRRFYGNKSAKSLAYGHWRINPENYLLFRFETKQENLIGYGERDGSFSLCEKQEEESFFFDPNAHEGFSHSEITGQSHPLNQKAWYRRIKEKNHVCKYEGEIISGDGGKRYFSTHWAQWPNQNFQDYCVYEYIQGKIHRERLPNGNILKYEYKTLKGPHPVTYFLSKITAYNAAETVELGSLRVDYEEGKRQLNYPVDKIQVIGSDNRQATLHHQLRTIQKKSTFKGRNQVCDLVLQKVEAPGKPLQTYDYIWKKELEKYEKSRFMNLIAHPQGRELETEYDTPKKRVVRQLVPVGERGRMAPIAQYEYQEGSTTVIDGEGNKTLYRYDKKKRITAIEKWEGANLFSIERFTWDHATGNLLEKTIEDGVKSPLFTATFTYDENHNRIEERVGDGVHSDTIYREFSQDGYNLLLWESDRPGKSTCCTYLPNTNLCSSEIVYEGEKVRKRTFHFYDETLQACKIKTVVDDGTGNDSEDLTGVTYRIIKEVSPKREAPCLGLPEEIREKSIDEKGKEILLKKVQYAYHPSGKIEREDHYDATGAFSYSLSYEYDSQERLTAKTDPLGYRTTYAYDANFNCLKEEGPTRKEWRYDKVNRPIQEIEWVDDTTSLVTKRRYDRCSRVISKIDPSGFETRFTYDSEGRVVATHYPDGAVERREYDPFGNVVLEVDGCGYETQREYDFRGKPSKILYPDGTKESFFYGDDGGELLAHTDKNGAITRYGYDLFRNCIKEEVYSPEGELLKTSSSTFSPFHKLSETDPEGNTTYFSYDFAGRLQSRRKGRQETLFLYDSLGREVGTKEGDTVTLQILNERGEILEKRIENSAGDLLFHESYEYDGAGNQIALMSCVGTTSTSYNGIGNPVEKIDPLGNKTTFSYCYERGLQKTTRDPLGVETVETYDARSRLTDTSVYNNEGELLQKREKGYDLSGNQIIAIEHQIKGDPVVHSWVYGPLGRVERQLEGGIRETLYAYDEFGRVKTTQKPDGTYLEREYDSLGRLSHYFGPDFDYHYTYDLLDRVTQVGETSRKYDEYGNLIEESLANGISLRSTYNPYGKREALSLPHGKEVRYSYHGPYLKQVFYDMFQHTYADRNLAGKPTRIILPQVLGEIKITYDPLLRWESYNSPRTHAAYAYDAQGNLASYTFSDPLGEELQTYTYDSLSQLTSENSHTYTYDSLFNRTSKDNQPHTLNSLSELLSDGKKTYEYDRNGNLISDQEHIYAYDSLDRLISVNHLGRLTTYTYDPFNRRIRKNDLSFIWDGKNEIGAAREGKIQELRILGEGIGAETGAAVVLEIQGTPYIPLHDHQGSITTLLSKSGKPLETYRYTAFGELLTQPTLLPWHFASKRFDPETGLLFFGRRYYSPPLGRWITPDPAGYGDGPNLYAYLHNSPLTNYDLEGLFSLVSMWTGMQQVGLGVASFGHEAMLGAYYMTRTMGEWMGADILYEMGERAHFQAKSQEAYTGWQTLGNAFAEDPLKTTGSILTPHLTEFIKSPSIFIGTKAAIDVGLFAFTATKATRTLTSKPLSTGRMPTNTLATERILEGAPSQIAGLTKHGMARAVQREISEQGIIDAMKNPLCVKDIKFDHLGRPSQRFIGMEAEVVINPSTKQIVSVNPTSTRKVEKLKRP